MLASARSRGLIAVVCTRTVLMAVALGSMALYAFFAAPPALATGITVTDPITNKVGVDVDDDIASTYDAAIQTSTVNTQTFAAHGMMSGLIDGTFSFGGGNTVVTLDPDDDYFAGEVVRVSATAGIFDTGASPVHAYQWQFTAGPVYSRCFGSFSDIGAGLPGVSYGSVAWGDYDNDGLLDVLLTGWDSSVQPLAQVWHNDGGGSFTNIGAGLTGVYAGSAAWGDYDNDGLLDILLAGNAGTETNPNPILQVWHNDGGGLLPASEPDCRECGTVQWPGVTTTTTGCSTSC